MRFKAAKGGWIFIQENRFGVKKEYHDARAVNSRRTWLKVSLNL